MPDNKSNLSESFVFSALESDEEFPIALSEVWECLGYFNKATAKRSFLSIGLEDSVDYMMLSINAEPQIKGFSPLNPEQDVLMTVDSFKLWAMSAQTEAGKKARRYFLEIEKKFIATQKTSQPRITTDHITAHHFLEDQYNPFLKSAPIAAAILRDWIGIESAKTTPQILETRNIEPEYVLPSAEIQDALGNAFLNLNRSGLAMNKLFKFIDRIPTMQNMGAEQIDSLVESLSEAGVAIGKLQGAIADRDKLLSTKRDVVTKLEKERDQLKREAKFDKNEITRLNGFIQNLQAKLSNYEESIAAKTIVATRVPKALKSA